MKKKITPFIVFALLTSFGFSNMANAAEKDLTKEKVIVVFKDSKNMNSFTSSVSGVVQKQFKNIPGFAGELTKAQIDSLKNNPNVVSVEKDVRYKMSFDESDENKKPVKLPKQQEDWGFINTKVKEAHDLGLTGKGVKIGIIDSGTEMDHPDLKVVGGTSFTVDYKKDGSRDTSYEDYAGHGTHVAGIVGAKDNAIGTVGVAPDSQLYSIKVLDSSGYCDLSAIMSAVDWAITNDMDIINLSLGGGETSTAAKELFNTARKNGMLIVAAAGNEYLSGYYDTVRYPAKYESVIAVGATDKINIRAYFSSTGAEVDMAGPGYEIMSTYLNGEYMELSGTSMASPYVTGILALYKEAYPNATNEELQTMIQKNALDIGDTGKDEEFGYGLAQAPTINNVEAVSFVNTINTFERVSLYNEPTESSKLNQSLAPQSLKTIKKYGNWLLVKTYLGDKWIKPTQYVVGDYNPVGKKITLKSKNSLFDYPTDGSVSPYSLTPQSLYADAEYKGFYRVQTWIGPKWLKGQNAKVEDYREKVRLTERTPLYSSPDANKKLTAQLASQTVTALEKRGEWYRIQTYLGSNIWIKPNYPIVGEVVAANQLYTLSKVSPLYTVPYTTTKPVGNAAPQTVRAIEKYNNWILIDSFKGKVWVQI